MDNVSITHDIVSGDTCRSTLVNSLLKDLQISTKEEWVLLRESDLSSNQRLDLDFTECQIEGYSSLPATMRGLNENYPVEVPIDSFANLSTDNKSQNLGEGDDPCSSVPSVLDKCQRQPFKRVVGAFRVGGFRFPWNHKIIFKPVMKIFLSYGIQECQRNDYTFIRKEDQNKLKNIYQEWAKKDKDFIDGDIFPKAAYSLLELILSTFSNEKISLLRERTLACQLGGLIDGSPGTGKSMFIKYIKNKIKEHNIDVLDNTFCYSASQLTKLADNNGSLPQRGIIILDDIESVIRQRVEGEGFGAENATLSWLLNELDNGDRNVCRLILVITNYRKAIDEAMSRAGRLDLHITFEPPENNNLLHLFEFHTKDDVPKKTRTKIIELMRQKIEDLHFGSISLLCRLAYTAEEPHFKSVDFWSMLMDQMNNMNMSSESGNFGFGGVQKTFET